MDNYNNIDKLSEKLNKVDFSNKQSVDDYINTLSSLKKTYNSLSNNMNNNWLGRLFKENFINIDVNKIVDNLIETANKLHNEAVTEKNDRPSAKVPAEVLHKISDLVAEYVDDVISKNKSYDTKTKKDMYEVFTEFACWVYSHK